MKKNIRGFITLIFLLVVFIVIAILVQRDLSLRDTSALYGGELERGYPSAGYLVSYETGGSFKTCGYSVLNSRIAVTASHCVDNSEEIYLGTGDFSLDKNKQIKVRRAIQKEGWVNSQERSEDFAILEIDDRDGFFQTFAEIASPREGCDYRVVAYGRTEDARETFDKPRKSGSMCAEDIRSKVFFIQGDTAGICFGDSGSPLFYEGTNKLAGVIASIVLEDPSNPEPCAIGNKAIVVRADSNQQLINDTIQGLNDRSVSGTSVVDGLTIEVSKQSFWQKVGLTAIDKMPVTQRLQMLLYISIGALITLVGITVYFLLKPEKTGQRLPEDPWA